MYQISKNQRLLEMIQSELNMYFIFEWVKQFQNTKRAMQSIDFWFGTFEEHLGL